MEEYRAMREVVEGSMGVLCNLCALPGNGESFVMSGELGLLDTLFSDPESGDNVRLASASVLHNLAANPDTALLLSSDEGIDLLVKIIRKAPVDSPLFLNTLKVLAALLFKLPNDNKPAGNKKPDVMKRIIQRGLLATLNLKQCNIMYFYVSVILFYLILSCFSLCLHVALICTCLHYIIYITLLYVVRLRKLIDTSTNMQFLCVYVYAIVVGHIL
eukprot:87324_1